MRANKKGSKKFSQMMANRNKWAQIQKNLTGYHE